MVSNGIIWSRFYLICLGLRLCCIVFAGWSFWTYQEHSPQTLLTSLERTESRQAIAEEPESGFQNLTTALKNKVTIFGALFIFAYQGAEVAISGWVISFLINYRDGDPAQVGYVTAGFWVSLFQSLDGPTSNPCVGWHHIRSLRLNSSRPQNRREEICYHPRPRLLSSPTHGLAHSQRHWERSRSSFSRSSPRSSLSMRSNHLLTSHPAPCPDDGDRVYWWSGEFWRCCRTVHHWSSCTSCGDLGVASSVYRTVCCSADVLVQSAESEKEDGVTDRKGNVE